MAGGSNLTKFYGMIGVAAGGEIRVENSRGHKITESDYDPAVLVGLGATFKF